MTAQHALMRLGGPHGLLVRVARALALAWRAGPVSATLYLLITILQGLIPAAVTLLTAWLLNGIAGQPAGPGELPLMVLVSGIGVLGVVAAALPYGAGYLRSRLSRAITLCVQERLYNAVNGFAGMSRFETPAFLDRLRLAHQSATMAPDKVVSSVLGIVQSALSIVSFLGILISISPVVTAVTVGAAVPALFVQLSVSRRQATMMWTLSPRSRRQLFYQTLMLDVAAVKEIRLFGLGDFLAGRMRRETVAINLAEERLDRRILMGQGPLAALGAVVAATGLLLLITGALGPVQVGDISAFIAAVAGVQTAMSGIITGATEAYHALLMFGHYIEVSDMTSDLPAAENPAGTGRLAQGLVLEDIWFRYTDDGPWVLRGVDLTIPCGQSTALVGLNGAGKSTLVKLLCRLYDPTKGRISWDGVDIRQLDVDDYRDHISAVFQDYMCYDLPADENIGTGDLARLADHDRIVAAAIRADIHAFITGLPHGYRTMLSRTFLQNEDNDDPEQGVTLSGGQWQRVALARAMMRDQRDLLILDEPSAGLDAAAEQAVHDRLREHRHGATSVLISHRLGAVRHADRIIVLHNGQVTEQGTHDSLMRCGGEYARLFTIQAANYADVHSGVSK